MRPAEKAGAARARALDPRALWIGVGTGVAAILCCVSPVVLFLFGLASATEAIALGDRLYYGYAWYFRGAGVVLAGIAAVVYLRRRRSCSLEGARRYWRSLAGIGASLVVTYAALYLATAYLAELGSHRG